MNFMDCKKRNVKSGCEKKEWDKQEQFTLTDLIERYFRIDENGENYQIRQEKYLSELSNIVDFVCGVPNHKQTNEDGPYKVNSHQWPLRFPSRQYVIKEMIGKLKDINKDSFSSFDELYDYVFSNGMKYFRETASYDFALRFGWNQNPKIEPIEKVYFHGKLKESVKRLKELGYLNTLKSPVSYNDLPKEFKNAGMTARDIENFLCVFKDQILNLKK